MHAPLKESSSCIPEFRCVVFSLSFIENTFCLRYHLYTRHGTFRGARLTPSHNGTGHTAHLKPGPLTSRSFCRKPKGLMGTGTSSTLNTQVCLGLGCSSGPWIWHRTTNGQTRRSSTRVVTSSGNDVSRCVRATKESVWRCV